MSSRSGSESGSGSSSGDDDDKHLAPLPPVSRLAAQPRSEEDESDDDEASNLPATVAAPPAPAPGSDSEDEPRSPPRAAKAAPPAPGSDSEDEPRSPPRAAKAAPPAPGSDSEDEPRSPLRAAKAAPPAPGSDSDSEDEPRSPPRAATARDVQQNAAEKDGGDDDDDDASTQPRSTPPALASDALEPHKPLALAGAPGAPQPFTFALPNRAAAKPPDPLWRQYAARMAAELLARADAGEADAQCTLAKRLAAGEGVPLDLAEASTWWRKAADQGHKGAQFELARCLDLAKGVPRNEEEAVRCGQLPPIFARERHLLAVCARCPPPCCLFAFTSPIKPRAPAPPPRGAQLVPAGGGTGACAGAAQPLVPPDARLGRAARRAGGGCVVPPSSGRRERGRAVQPRRLPRKRARRAQGRGASGGLARESGEARVRSHLSCGSGPACRTPLR